ncbi:RES domain-containing protein, partial [Citrobacter sp. AAK_AS5]
TVRGEGHNGVVYPSVRDAGGTCIVALRPAAVQSVAQGALLRLTWGGTRTPRVEAL